MQEIALLFWIKFRSELSSAHCDRAMASNKTNTNESKELWQQCALWLSRHGVIPADHNVLDSQSSLFNFINLLRDGVLLCNLLNKIEPGSISHGMISLRPQLAQTLCIRNITHFIECTSQKFRLPMSDCFEPYMLFDYTDVAKVLHTLSELSKSDKSRRTHINGFPSEDNQMKELYTNKNYVNFANYATRDPLYDEFSVYEVKSENRNIYDDIYSSVKLDLEVEKYYECPTPRHYSIIELYETEKVYVNTLESLNRETRDRLYQLMRPEEFNMIFKHIGTFCDVHRQFLLRVESFVTGEIDIGEVFREFRHDFTLYGDYCANLPQAREKLKDVCAESPRVRHIVGVTESEIGTGPVKLGEILGVPFQRFLRYKILVQAILQHTRKERKDYLGLQEALTLVDDLGEFCNEVKRDSEIIDGITTMEASIKDYQNVFGMTSLKTYGRLIKDAGLSCKFSDGKTRKINLLLFEINMLICTPCKERNSKYTLEYFEGIRIVHTLLDKRAKDKTSFRLTSTEDQSVYTITTKTEKQKKEWMDNIEMAQDKLAPKNRTTGSHDFRLNTFPDPLVCKVCDRMLKGLLNQGYLCHKKGCGLAVHYECIGLCNYCGLPQPSPVQRDQALIVGGVPTKFINNDDVKAIFSKPRPNQNAGNFSNWTNKGQFHNPEEATQKMVPPPPRKPSNPVYPEVEQLHGFQDKEVWRPPLKDQPRTTPDSQNTEFRKSVWREESRSPLETHNLGFRMPMPKEELLEPQTTRPFERPMMKAEQPEIPIRAFRQQVSDEAPRPQNTRNFGQPMVKAEPLRTPNKVFRLPMVDDLPGSQNSRPFGRPTVKPEMIRTQNGGLKMTMLKQDLPGSPRRDFTRTVARAEPTTQTKTLPMASDISSAWQNRVAVPAVSNKPPTASSQDGGFEREITIGRPNTSKVAAIGSNLQDMLNQKRLQMGLAIDENVSRRIDNVSEKPVQDSGDIPSGPQRDQQRFSVAYEHIETEIPNFAANATPEPEPTPQIASQVYEMTNEHFFRMSYVGKMDREPAVTCLCSAQQGVFLVRSNKNGNYVISIKYNQTIRHLEVTNVSGQFGFSDTARFPSMQDLVSYYRDHSFKDSFHQIDSTLKVPFHVARRQS